MYLSIVLNDDPTGYVITIFSMLFTIISIVLGIFEYVFGAGFISSGSALAIQFDVEMNYINKMSYPRFRKHIMYKKRKVVGMLSTELEFDTTRGVDRLVPTRTKKGAKYTFIIEGNHNKIEATRKKFYQSVGNNSLAKVFNYMYFFYTLIHLVHHAFVLNLVFCVWMFVDIHYMIDV